MLYFTIIKIEHLKKKIHLRNKPNEFKNMIHSESSFHEIIDLNGSKHDIFKTLYFPTEKEAKATILILHGMQEHSGRYDDFARFLAAKGFLVMTYDHIGHGRSVKNKGALGYIQRQNPGVRLVDDGIEMAQLLANQYPHLPHFIIGHSMGSFITRCIVQEIGNLFCGVVLIGTGTMDQAAIIGERLLGLLNKILPKRKSTLINYSFGAFNNLKFKDEPNQKNSNWLSLAKENRDHFIADTLCGIPFSNNAFYATAYVANRGSGPNWTDHIPTTLPFLLESGEEDPIGNFGKGVIKTVQDLTTHGNNDVKYHLYPKMRHELLNESIKDEVYQEIVLWLDSKLHSPNT
jgi:alpha-beta hydrolase superfamily lysophospholipase